jgi:hypothetical protein
MTGDSDSDRPGSNASAPATPGKDESMQKYGSKGAQKLRSTADDNLIIMLNGEMIFGKRDGEHPRPRPNVLCGGVVPHQSALINTPAIVAEDGVREACDSLRVHDDSEGDVESRIFDQSTFGSASQGEEIAYDHSSIAAFGDTSSVGRLADSDSEIEMEGSYFASRREKQRARRQEDPTSSALQLTASVMSARGMACINDLSSDDEEEEEDDTVPRRYALSTPYRSNLLQDDWVRAWGEAWGLRVNKAEQQKRTNRLNKLHAKHEQPSKSLSFPLSQQARSPGVAPSTKQVGGPSVSAVLQEGRLAKAVAQVTGSPPPLGTKSSVKLPWGERTVMDWAQSEDVAKTPRTRVSPDLSMAMASAEKTVKKKSKWVFGDSELSEDEQDEKLGEENKDGEEAWTRSAKKQFRSVEPFRKLPAFDSNADDISKAVVLAQRKQGNPHSIRKHAMSSHEQRVMSAGDADMDEAKQRFLKYTPDIAKLRLQREKLRRGDYDGEDEHRPLFRRNDGRLVRKLNATALDDLVAQPQPTTVNLGHIERVGAWV